MHARNPFSPQAGVIKDHSYYLFFNDFKTVWSKGAYVADLYMYLNTDNT